MNASQSSNDAFPTALHVAAARAITHELLPAAEVLADTLRRRADELDDVVKPGRTHLMDAVPVTLGQELSGYAAQVSDAVEQVAATMPRLCEVPLGGTAVGTGPQHRRPASAIRWSPSSPRSPTSRSPRPATPSRPRPRATRWWPPRARCARWRVALTKIVNDLRWMGSGPRTGLHEIALPELQAGSSIMPGKVNPVIPEAVAQVCAHVIGLDASIAWGGAAGAFELNTMMPMMGSNLLEAITLLANACSVLEAKAVRGFSVDVDHLAAMAAASPAVVTALNTTIGYERAADIVKQAATDGVSIVDAVRARVDAGDLPAAALEAIDPRRLAHPHDWTPAPPDPRVGGATRRHAGGDVGSQIDTVDAYIDSFPAEVRPILEAVRSTIRGVLPNAEEAITYAIPTFIVDGRSLVHFAGWKHHVSVYPAPETDGELEERLARYRSGAATAKFPLNEPIPYDLIADIVELLRLQKD